MTDIMTTTEAARVLGVDTETIRCWCASGDLHARWISGVWVIARDSVRRALLRRKAQQFEVEAA